MRLGNLEISRNKRVFANGTNPSDVPTTTMSQQYTTPGMIARSAYDNGFAPISAISDEVLKRNVRLGSPTDPDVDVTASYPLWNAIARPNDRMGYLQFLDTLIGGILSLDEFSLLVWHINGDNQQEPGAPGNPEDKIRWTLDNISGFTVVPNACKGFDSKGNEEWVIDFGSGNGGTRKFTRDDIMTLKYSLLPDDGITGVSPGSASGQEAAIRDRLNQQVRASFDNGAVPSLIVTIHARTHEEYSAIQQAYERNNRGASKSGGVVYQSVIDNAMTQGLGEPKIEITPVGMTNNNLAIAEIVEFTQTTITSNYSVSPIIYGDATTTTYQNQNLAKAGFMDTVQSTLVRLFSNFENELMRLCRLDELPFTFVWDDVDIDITEEQKLKADINLTNVRSFVGLQQSGATPEQAALALGLSDEWKAIQVALVETPDIAPDAPTLNLFDEGCTCPEHKNAAPKRVSELEQQAQKKILNLLEELARGIFGDLKANAFATNELDQQIIDELISVMQQGSDTAVNGILKGTDIKGLADFSLLSQQSLRQLEARATKVLTNYTDFVSAKIDGLADDDPAKKVFKDFFAKHGQSRAQLIAQQETKTAYQNGELDSAGNIDSWLKKNQPQSYIVKTWTTTSDKPCRFCEKMDGTEAGIRDSFVPGQLIESGDQTLFLDSAYSDGTIPDAHANCQCVFRFKLVSKG